MKFKNVFLRFNLLIIVACFLMPNVSSAQQSTSHPDFQKVDKMNFYEISEFVNEYYERQIPEERAGWKQFKRWEQFWKNRVDQDGNFPNMKSVLEEYNTARKIKTPDYLLSNTWERLGPFKSPENTFSSRHPGVGRLNCVRFNPKNDKEFWVGAATGGVWKTIDGGASWNTFDFTNFMSLGVSDIAISPKDPNIVYVSTGDADGTYGTASVYYSIGVIKTIDGGKNWTTTSLIDSIGNRSLTARILVHPDNPDIVIATTRVGIFKTTDGGKQWNKKVIGQFVDMEYMPGNADIIYASTFSREGKTNIYKSVDNGETWKDIFKKTDVSRISIYTTKANPNAVYALLAASDKAKFHSFYVSENQGETWKKHAELGSSPNILGWYAGNGSDAEKGQGDYDIALAVSPTNASEIITGGINIWKSNDKGSNWSKKSQWNRIAQTYVHADQHDLQYSPDGKRLYSCNDGGLFVSLDNGSSWEDVSKTMDITQYYRISNSAVKEDLILGGAQDNGSHMYYNGRWHFIEPGGDGMDCVLIPQNNNTEYVISSLYNGTFATATFDYSKYRMLKMFRKENFGETTAAWITPVGYHPSNKGMFYVAYTNLWKSDLSLMNKTNLTENLSSGGLIEAFAVAPSDAKTIYVIKGGSVFRTTDEGNTWKTVFTASGKLTWLAVHDKDPKRLWVTISGYNEDEKVYEIKDENAINLSGNLPNVPINSIAYQKKSNGRIYIGTDVGVFTSDNGSAFWDKFGSDMPSLIIREIEISEPAQKVRIASYGRGVWEADLIDCISKDIEITVKGELEFCKGESVTLEAKEDLPNYKWTSGETTKSIVVKDAGVYSLASNVQGYCYAKSKAIEVKTKTVKEITIIPNGNVPVCEGQKLQLKVSTYSLDNYKWNTGATAKRIDITTPGKYYYQALNSSGCYSYSDTLDVQFVDAAKKPSITKNDTALVSTEATEYLWFVDDRADSDGRGRYYKPSKTAKIKVEITNANGCTAMSDEYDFKHGSSVLANNIKNSIVVSPNPGNGLFELAVNHVVTGTLNIEISNILGASIYSVEKQLNGESFNHTIDIQNVATGTYVLKISTNSFSKVIKLIKK